MKLVSNLSELITEIAAISDMTDSIKKRNVVTIYYDGNDNGDDTGDDSDDDDDDTYSRDLLY